MSSPVSGINSGNRTTTGRNRTSAKPFPSSPVFEGVYNNARMLHFLTAVVGSTCDIRVKNGSVFEGIFKTLSSRCELAVDAVHKCSGEDSSSVPPRREDITDTMIFSPSDLVTMICRDVDLNFATRDTFTDSAISSTRINGEHKEKVLQRWEGGDSNGESYDLENDASNGWDANEMFRYNEVKYGVTSTYDASLSMYTVPLERGNSEVFRQREARAARLANEIESSPQYRHRVSLENDEGKSEEDKYSSVVRDSNDRERGRESPRDREEGKYIPLPQRQREMNRERERAERGPGGPPPHNRLSGGYRSTPPSSSSSSPRPPLPSAAGPQPGVSPSERSSPLSARGGAYAPHHPQGSPSPGPGSASPPAPHGHTVPHSHSLPHSLSDVGRPVNGGKPCSRSFFFFSCPQVSARTSPKAQRPPQSSRTGRGPNSHNQSTGRVVMHHFVSATLNVASMLNAFVPFRLCSSSSFRSGFDLLMHPGGQGPLYNTPYLSYVSQIHPVQVQRRHEPPPMYQYTMSTVSQGKYPRTKGSVVAPRSDHGTSAPPILQAAASAAGAPLVASPYPQSYLQYNPQQYSQQQVIQAMTPYPGQPMYSMLQGGARMIGQGGGPHPQALGPPGGPQFPTQGDGPQGPQQGIYAPQSFSHHSGAVHQPQPSSTPTGNQPPPQHAAPSPGQNAQSGPQPQSLYHSGPLSAPTPPNMPPGHTSPQGSYPIQGYSIHSHQGIPPTYPLGQIAQAHVQGAMSGPHHSGSHGQPQLVMLQPQQGPGAVPQHPQHGPQQGAHQHFYIGQHAMQVQTHPASFHPPGN
uniref:Ataxin-2-like protein n=1 Tax=Salarias fasciatus TaxID=181472 RepID=A0A672IKF4_SALFA